ncbi:MAG: metal-sensitive transcriptional regulator [Solirubrobacteraceae bacterium]
MPERVQNRAHGLFPGHGPNLAHAPWGYLLGSGSRPKGHSAARLLGLEGSADRALRRIEGQVGGVQRMVEEDRYCIDVLTSSV